jgi:hypothetical protein
MDRPRILRLLRIAFSVVCGIICLLLIVFWFRSYGVCEIVSHGSNEAITIGSNNGTVYIARSVVLPLPLGSSPPSDWKFQTTDVQLDKPTLFTWSSNRKASIFYLPFWFLVIGAAALSAMPWLRWQKRFSLRTLLIATTVVAALLGAIVYAIR